MRETALITGASNGIGLELAKIHASKGGDLVLVARSKEKLETLKRELKSQFDSEIYVISKDLSRPGSALEVYTETLHNNIEIDFLINNAGFGDYGLFHETDWNKELQMISLNITTLTQFTKLYLKEMIRRGKGRIMNLASLAAFQPGPSVAVYSATKSYVLSFSEAINHELRHTGITVTSLCPGPTESGFMEAASMGESKLFSGKKIPSSREVAEYGYKSMMAGKAVAIHSTRNKILANSSRFAPRSLVVTISRKIQEKAK